MSSAVCGMSEPDVHGTAAPGFEAVAACFKDNLKRYGEVGGALCVHWRGAKVVDLWAGQAVRPSAKFEAREWKSDTVANIFSGTKVMANLCVLWLQDQGRLSLSDRVAQHWPEFGCNGKDNISIEQLLSHQGGLAALDGEPFTKEDMHAWNKSMISYQLTGQREPNEVTRRLEEHTLNYDLAHGYVAYHPITVGFYVSELVQRVDANRRVLQNLFAEEIARPLDADVFIGVDSEFDTSRIAKLYGARPTEEVLAEADREEAALASDKDLQKAVQSTMARAAKDGIDVGALASSAFGAIRSFSVWHQRHLNVPSAIGFATARGLSIVFNHLVGVLRGAPAPLLSRASLLAACSPACSGVDLVLGSPSAFTRAGLAHAAPALPGALFHAGSGGSVGLMQPARHLAFAFIPNALEHKSQTIARSRYVRLLQSVYQCIDQQTKARL